MKKTLHLTALMVSISLSLALISCNNPTGSVPAGTTTGTTTTPTTSGENTNSGSSTTDSGNTNTTTTTTSGNESNNNNSVTQQPSSAPEGFVRVIGATVNGAITGSYVFIADRSVTIPTMYVCDHEVTQAEYQAVMGNNPSSFNGSQGKEAATGEIQANRPVEKVSWFDTIVYCNKRSIAENLTPCYTIKKADDTTVDSTNPTDWGTIPTNIPVRTTDANYPSYIRWNSVICNFSANGYRLPTQVEWEYVAREGSTLSTNKYCGTNNKNELINYAWYSTNSGNKTHEVKKKMANALGIYDMSGNVSEWCWDYAGYVYSTTGVEGPSSSTNSRVYRGGSYFRDDFYCTAKYNSNQNDIWRDCDFGFRVVRSAQ